MGHRVNRPCRRETSFGLEDPKHSHKTPALQARAFGSTQAVDLRTLDRDCDVAQISLILALSCRSCRSNAPFPELVRLSKAQHRGRAARGARMASRR